MIKNFKSSIFAKLASTTTIVAMLSLVIGPSFALAASVSTASDTLSRESASTASNHTILFVTPTGVASGTNITLTFSGGTGISSLVGSDFDFAQGSSGTCSSATFTEQSVVTSAPSTSQFSIAGSGSVVTITSGGATATITAGRCVRLKIGLNATDTTGSGPGVNQITNPTAGTLTITVGGTFGDSGTISIPIVDSDQVNISATVNQSLTFDIDTAITNTDTNAPYTVALGTLTTANASNSDNTGINSIWLDLGTNSSGGVNVTVVSSNGALKSTSTPADSIPSATGTMAPGVANYGVCVNTATAASGTLTKASPFNGGTCTSGHTDTVGALTTAPQNIITSTTPIGTGRVEIRVAAENTTLTPAHNDYSDTQTYIATSTF
jgi:hypothetical protein